MSDLTLDQIIAAAAGTSSTPKKSSKPIGSVKLTLAGMTLFTRSIWAESTSDDKVASELNELCLQDKEKAIAAFKILLSKVEVEITGKSQSTAASLADLLK